MVGRQHSRALRGKCRNKLEGEGKLRAVAVSQPSQGGPSKRLWTTPTSGSSSPIGKAPFEFPIEALSGVLPVKVVAGAASSGQGSAAQTLPPAI